MAQAKHCGCLKKIAVDFVKEEDGWKIWHIVVSTDLVSEAGEDYSEQEVYHNYETNPVDVEFGTPTIAKLIHNTDFNWWDNYPPMPEAYETFSDAVSYGPEGMYDQRFTDWIQKREEFPMKSKLSLHERIRNANASQEVEKVKARHTYLHGRADATGEWADIWSRDPNCSWAHIFGRMRGFDQVWYARSPSTIRCPLKMPLS